MKILDILRESFRTERIEQHNKANKLRALYKERDVLKTAARDAMSGRRSEEAYDKLIDELEAVEIEIEYLEKGMTESIETDHKEMLRGLQQALTKASADLAEMEDDLRVMKGTARTEEELDAVDDYRVHVEKKRALVERLAKRVKLRKAALGGVA